MPDRSDARLRRPQDVQALHRRRVPALGVRPHLPGPRRPRHGCWPTRRRRRARTSGTPSRRPARRSRGWSGATAYNRGQVLYRIAEMLEGRREQFAAEVAATEGLTPRARRRAGRRRDRPAGSLRRLDRQVRPGRRRDEPGRRAVLHVLAARADRRGRRARAAGVLAARAGLGPRAGARHRQHRRRGRRPGPPAAGHHARRGAGHVRPARRRASTCSPASPPSWRRGWPRTATSTPSTSPAPTPTSAPRCETAAADTVKRVYVAARRRTGRGTPDSPGSRRSSRPRRCGTRSGSEPGSYVASS